MMIIRIVLFMSVLWLARFSPAQNVDQQFVDQKFKLVLSYAAGINKTHRYELRTVQQPEGLPPAKYWWAISESAVASFASNGRLMLFSCSGPSSSVSGSVLSESQLWARGENLISNAVATNLKLQRKGLSVSEASGVQQAVLRWIDDRVIEGTPQGIEIIFNAQTGDLTSFSCSILLDYGPTSKALSVEMAKEKASHYLEAAIDADPSNETIYAEALRNVAGAQPVIEWVRPTGGFGDYSALRHVPANQLRLCYSLSAGECLLSIDANTGELQHGLITRTLSGPTKSVPNGTRTDDAPKVERSVFTSLAGPIICLIAVVGGALFFRSRHRRAS